MNLPAKDLAAEEAFLGGVFQAPACFDSVSHLLEVADFYSESHGKVFEVMLDLSETGEPIDYVTVSARCKEKGYHQISAGELTRFVDLGIGSESYLRQYAKSIRGASIRRHIRGILQEVGEESQDFSVDLQALVARTIDQFQSLQTIKKNGRSLYEPVLLRISDVVRENVGWLWTGRIPLGKLTLLQGDPGIGKSYCSLAIATAVSVGYGLPGEQTASKPANVLILASEDGPGDTIRPRLEDMGADLQKIIILRGKKKPKGEEEQVTLLDLDILERAIEIEHPRLTVVDPLIAYLGGKDEWKAGAVRGVLGPVASIAEKTGTAVVGIGHLVKSATRAIYKGQGSIDFLAQCRSAFLFGENPDSAGEYVMAHIKSSLAPKASSLIYSVANGRFLWGGESTLTAEQVLAEPASGEERTAADEAKAFLLDLLANGPIGSAEIQKQARGAGIAERTLWRAKIALGVKAVKGGFAGGWKWSLPSEGCQQGPKSANFDGDGRDGSLGGDWQPSGLNGEEV